MMNQTSTNTMRRLAKVVILAVALPLVALVPVFVASILLPPSPSDSTTSELNVPSNETNDAEIAETVLVTLMTDEPFPLHDADIITITIDDPQNTNRSAFDLDLNCRIYLVADDPDNSHPETFTGHIKVGEQDDSTWTSCFLYWTDSTDE